MRRYVLSSVVAALFVVCFHLQAQPLVNIETVTVGDPGNAADTTGYGAVTNVFRIGKYEVTISQYAKFLNSVAQTDTNSYILDLWDMSMMSNPYAAGISRSGSGTAGDPYTYSVIGPHGGITPTGASSPGNRPIAFVSWFDAARFANWMNNGATNGASTETGAYTLNGATSGVGFTKNPGATWWIPSEDEWYKAAYYKSGGVNAGYWGYPTKSDTNPGNTIGGATNQANFYAGGVHAVTQSARDWTLFNSQNYLTDVGAFSNSASSYGTFDQGGNVMEWNDAVIEGSSRGVRGGGWNDNAEGLSLWSLSRWQWPPWVAYATLGFRVASVAPANIVLTVEKSSNLSGQWQFDREINVGPMTNSKEFYRLKISTVVQ